MMAATIKSTGAGFFVPDDLRDRPQWLVWKFLQKDPNKKPSKIPYYATTGNLRGWPNGKPRDGEPTALQPQVDQGHEIDRAHLVTFEEAQQAAKARGMDGVGFAFLPNDGLIGIDIDACIDSDDSARVERAQKIIRACNSFAEYSPSGNGVHIIVRGETTTFKSNKIGVEVFCGRQFFTFTGAHVPGTPQTVNQISDSVIDRLRTLVRGEPSQPQPRTQHQGAQTADLERVEAALGYIDPDTDYESWLRVGMAIKSEFGDSGMELWDSWSRNSSKYKGIVEIRSHWRSFKGQGVTIGTLFKMAKDGGWKPPRDPNYQRPVPTPVQVANDCIDYETGEVLKAGNDNNAEMLGPLSSWLLARTRAIRVMGRDAEDGVWLRVEGKNEPKHFAVSDLLKKQNLLNLLPISDWEALIMQSNQGDRFSCANAASALMAVAREMPTYKLPEKADVAALDRLTGVQGVDSALLAKKLQDFTLFDVPSQAWYRWNDVWCRINEEVVRKAIVDEVDRDLEGEFENAYINGTVSLLKTRLARVADPLSDRGDEIWETDRNLLPMKNGILDLETREIVPHSPDYMFNWLIPHNYDPTAECPVTQQFIYRLAGGDTSTEAVLYAFLGAVLHGRYDLERYLEFVGMAGTGKSTYITLCKELVGAQNVHSTDMKTLHNNQFETANIYGKRLVMISDADKYGGDIGIFKSMTGRDVIRREEKNRQAQSGFVYKGMVIIAANNPVQFSDSSTAMVRRRVPVHIDKKLDKTEVDYKLSAKLAQEIPGLINLLLEKSQDEITEVLSDFRGNRRHASMRAMIETNNIAAWANDNLIVSNTGSVQVGKLGMEPSEFLYPNFSQYCEQTGRKGVVSFNTFTRSLQDVLTTAGIEIVTKKRNTGMHIYGVRLRTNSKFDDDLPPLLVQH